MLKILDKFIKFHRFLLKIIDFLNKIMISRLELWVLSKISNFSSKTKQKLNLIDILHVKLIQVNIIENFDFKFFLNFTLPQLGPQIAH